MIKQTLVSVMVAAGLSWLISCHSGTSRNEKTSVDTAQVAAGAVLFNRDCAGCHNFRQDGIGPQLGGIAQTISEDWFTRFVTSPQELISAGDPRAKALFERYKTVMPGFANLKQEDQKAVYAFLQTRGKEIAKPGKDHGQAISNPYPDSITFSGLVVNLKQFSRIPATASKPPLSRITKLDFEPGSGRLFVVDLRGKLYGLQPDGKPFLYLDMVKERPKFIHEPGLATGFGSFAFHPDFRRNGLFYTTHTEAPGSATADFHYADSIKVTVQWVLTEWKTDHPGADAFSGTSRELLRVNMVSGIHGVQEIAFNPAARAGSSDHGLLYIGIGDGGAVENGYPFLAHSRDKPWGAILRIDPSGHNSANGKYGIPSSNPFAGKAGWLGEIYAYGFRNPHRISWTHSGDLLACNVGQTNIEAVDLIRPGHDYGWPVREGHFLLDPFGDLNKIYSLPADDSLRGFTYPVAAFDHGEGHAISGGLEYLGRNLPLLRGKYLFADIPSGRLFYIELADIHQGRLATIKEWKIRINGVPTSFRKILGNERVDIHFGRDSRGELYILTKADGEIYRLSAD